MRGKPGRYTVVALLLISVAAHANPVVAPPPARIYIASEKLSVKLSIRDAEVTGTFMFRHAGSAKDLERWSSVAVNIPIWFPEQDTNAPVFARFGHRYQGTSAFMITPETKAAFEIAVGLKMTIGQHELLVNRFYAWSERDSKFWDFGEPEAGFRCLLFPIEVPVKFLLTPTPVTISYRQPLLQTSIDARFYYIPFFENLPNGTATTNQNIYAITLTAPDNCRVTGTNGIQGFSIGPGQSTVLAPLHHQAIRAVVTPLPARERKPVQ